MNLTILIPSKSEERIFDMVTLTEQFFPDAQIIVSNEKDGRGKGWNLRMALTQATGDVICFIDGDLDIHPRMIKRLLPFLGDYDIVVGKKQVRGLLSRRIITRLSRWFIWALFGLNLDTQTGIKLFKRAYLPDWKTDSYAFDIEVLWKASQWGAGIIEVPVEVLTARPMKFHSLWRSLVDALKIRFYYATPTEPRWANRV